MATQPIPTSKLIPYSKFLTTLMSAVTREHEHFYGPVYTKMVVKYATEFEAKKLADNNHAPLESLEQCVNYIISNAEKYPDGFCAIAYGMVKAENVLQGGIGSGARTFTKDAMKRFAEKTGAATIYGKITETLEAERKYFDFFEKTFAFPLPCKVSGDKDSATVLHGDCHFGDACIAMAAEKIRRLNGATECILGKTDSAIVETITHCAHDYDVPNFNPPKCTYRIFKAE